ncbi:sigma-70 family RNA polymerase sigma factor [Patescibacteria group bacterium]|nr:sigma-70 family RNA polymerase sigma factor [Patescibacteria group bacterium]
MSPSLPLTIVDKIKAGHETSITVWFKTFYPFIKQFVASRVKRREDVEELVQKIFIDSLQQISLLRDKNKLYPWMLGIAGCRVADFYRKQYAKKVIRHLPLGERVLALDSKDIDQVSQDVQSALALMKQTSRDLLLLKYLDNKQVAEIAFSQNTTPKTIEAQLYRARQEFKLCWTQITATI